MATTRPTTHISSPNEPYPSATDLAAATTTHRQGAFLISSRKLPISKAGPIEALERDVGIPVPEMIFGDNLVRVEHVPSGWAVKFAARDALDAVDKTDRHMLQVAYASAWSASREQTSAGIREVVRPFDWSYSTTYRGTVIVPPRPTPPPPPTAPVPTSTTTDSGDDEQKKKKDEDENEDTDNKNKTWGEFRPTARPIPIELLKRRDPILFFDEVMLYESELDDNGISVLSAKVRVHERRMLLLCRLFMRLDNVVVRVRDTRVYVDFAAEEVTREYTVKEAAFADVRQKLLMTGLRPDAITVALRDANQIVELLPTLEHTLESVSLKS
ncbi:TIP41-like family-domain-containing protein [Biscogniauxia marginata]|nr:TIP41-like family-domain-containing protein [Biscogniauxia marginata]